MIVDSLSIVILSALPNISGVNLSNVRPVFSDNTTPPVKIARSLSVETRFSPRKGALIAATLNPPRTLLIANVAVASPEISPPITNKDLLASEAACKMCTISCTFSILFGVIKISGLSNTAVCFS